MSEIVEFQRPEQTTFYPKAPDVGIEQRFIGRTKPPLLDPSGKPIKKLSGENYVTIADCFEIRGGSFLYYDLDDATKRGISGRYCTKEEYDGGTFLYTVYLIGLDGAVTIQQRFVYPLISQSPNACNVIQKGKLDDSIEVYSQLQIFTSEVYSEESPRGAISCVLRYYQYKDTPSLNLRTLYELLHSQNTNHSFPLYPYITVANSRKPDEAKGRYKSKVIDIRYFM